MALVLGAVGYHSIANLAAFTITITLYAAKRAGRNRVVYAAAGDDAARGSAGSPA